MNHDQGSARPYGPGWLFGTPWQGDVDPATLGAPTASDYVICSSQRTASTLLSEALASTGVAGLPSEWFLILMQREVRVRFFDRVDAEMRVRLRSLPVYRRRPTWAMSWPASDRRVLRRTACSA